MDEEGKRMGLLPVYERLAELWTVKQRRALSEMEAADMEHALAVNAAYVRRLAHLYNCSLLASMSEDPAWQHEICAQIEKMQTLAMPRDLG
jgi:hypothetical protein